MMTNRRELTEYDLQKISDLWRTYASLKKLRDSALPSTAKGAWLADACQTHMDLIALELEELFKGTY